ncbi:MAG: serine/threonine-protein kinase [Phenylobacterium sp.]|uniref:serine/threonine-protein kinase n=1 Tax=Phenylobacterium sp. TaxID=1871053 RepID=UPI00120E8040|nr:serine/threonine-protein kinase [Phenylobacterium sp.]TAJ71961.1 MAG: serine/threonine-protein kinase [Phenylobacterium sp.]
MNSPRSAEVERRALALFERLSARPKSRDRLLKAETPDIVARVEALERSAAAARAMLPTDAGLSAPIEPPDRVGPFRLIRQIGSGGMGSVWLAERDDGLYEQRVAVKFLHAELGALAAERFAVERRLLAKLEAPSIARVIDGGLTADGLAYVIMEYVDGETIDVASADHPARGRVGLFRDAAEAVQFAHSRLIVHGDLKPSNIMVDRDGRVRLLDFGLARLTDTDDDGHSAAHGPMTHGFASPQRAAGAAASIADDVFALGVVLGQLIGGMGEPDLAAIANKAASPAEDDRYSSVAALIADIDRWRERLPVRARPASFAYRARLFVRRHRVGVAMTAAAMLVLACSAGVATANYVAAERARAQSERRFSEVRAISRYMLFDLYDRLANAPGTVEARVNLAQTAGRYLDRLSASPGAPVDLRLEIAQGYRRLARVQGITNIANLGQPAAAERSLDRAEALAAGVLAAQPGSAEALELRGWIEVDRWTLKPDTAESRAATERGRNFFLQALKQEPGRTSARLGLLETEKDRAYDLTWGENRPADAIPVLQAALAELRRLKLETDEAKLVEVGILNRLGDATYYANHIPEALEPYRAAEAIVDERLRRGEKLEWLARKGESAWNVSGTLSDMAQKPAALDKAREGEAVMQRVLSYGPDAQAEKLLLVLYGHEATLLADLQRPVEAIAPARLSLALREARARLARGDPARERDLAVGLEFTSRVFAEAGRRREACAMARRSTATWDAIAAAGRLGQKDAADARRRAEQAEARYC